jgi:hypothetical protein
MDTPLLAFARAAFQAGEIENRTIDHDGAIIYIQTNKQPEAIGIYDDPYIALEHIAENACEFPGVKYLAIDCCGWAAPASGEECVPSEHPERVRVRLVAAIDRNLDLVSVVGFENANELGIHENETAQKGSLPHALAQTMAVLIFTDLAHQN